MMVRHVGDVAKRCDGVRLDVAVVRVHLLGNGVIYELRLDGVDSPLTKESQEDDRLHQSRGPAKARDSGRE